MLTFGRHAAGLGATALVLACAVHAARCLRARLLPDWSGPSAWVADATIALAVLTTVAQVLGAVDRFAALPLLAAELLATGALLVLAARLRPRTPEHETAPVVSAAGRGEIAAALAGVALVAVQWATHAGDAIDRGMVYSDTLWYHQPFAARFVQHGSFDVLDGVGLEAARLYPLGSPLVHAMGILAFDRDVLSPLVNLGWLALLLTAAWSIGRRCGRVHLCVLAAASVAALPILSATQPGQASSDIGAMALLLCAAALLVERDGSPAQLAVAGAALGMAVSMKITVAAPAAVLAIGVLVLLARRRSWRAAATWTGGVVATGTFWFARNWWLVGSPLPWFDLRIGPLRLEAHRGAEAALSGEPALLQSVGDGWGSLYLEGVRLSFGRAWPAVLALLVVAIAIVVVRGSTAIVRLVGVAAGVGVLAYLVTPYTGQLNFTSGLRFLAPLVLLALVFAPVALPASQRWRTGQLCVQWASVLVSVTAPSFERVPTWPTGGWALAAALVLVVLVAVVVVRDRRPPWASTAAVVVIVLGVAWLAPRAYLQNRYVDAGLANDGLNERLRDVRGARVAVFGTDDTLPMFGLDLSNDVRRGDDPPVDPGPNPCRTWQEELAGDDYVVIAGTPDAFGFYPAPPPELFDDPDATVVYEDGADVIYRIEGELDGGRC